MSMNTFQRPIEPQPRAVRPPPAQSLGDHLVQMGRLKRPDIDRILDWQRANDCSFGKAAVALGLVTEADVTVALAKQFHYPISREGTALQAASKELVIAHEPFSPAAERLRGIRTALLQKSFGQKRQSLAIIGAESGVGATYLAANLAVAFGQLGIATLLVDANLRHGRVAELFGLNPRRAGLAEFLRGLSDPETAEYQEMGPSVSLVTAGATPPNPQELLCSGEFVRFKTDAERRFQAVIYDTSTGAESTDALIVAGRVGSAVLVARQGHTAFAGVQALATHLAEIGSELVGTVLNTV
jgi:chain length determinant protein tyrosine kinase EpsG